jgi:hypothetical protein
MNSIASGIYGAICSLIRTRTEHALRIASGEACEKWLAAEARVSLNWLSPQLLSRSQWIANEVQRRDLVVLDRDEHGREFIPCVFEIKVLYSSYPPSKALDKLFELRNQICRSAKPRESLATRYAGMVVAIWDTWKPRYPDDQQFFGYLTTSIHHVFDSERFGPKAGQSLQVLAAPTAIRCWNEERNLAIATSMIELLQVEADVHKISTRAFDKGQAWFTTSEVQGHLQELKAQ